MKQVVVSAGDVSNPVENHSAFKAVPSWRALPSQAGGPALEVAERGEVPVLAA